MSATIAFNTTDTITTIAAQLAKGGHSDLLISNAAPATTGTVQNIIAKQTAAVAILFTSPTAYQVYKNGVAAGTGTVGVLFTSEAVDFLATGTFGAAERYDFQTFAPPTIIRQTATQLAWTAERGGAVGWVGVETTTAGSSVPILRIVAGTSLNSGQTISNQTGAVSGYMPLPSNASANLNWRWDGGWLTLRVADGSPCKVIGAGFTHSIHDPAAWSHPLAAYGCGTVSGTTTTYKAGWQTGTTQIRDTAGAAQSLATAYTAATASAIATAAPGAADMPLIPVLGHIATIGLTGKLPHLFVAFPNTSFTNMLQSRTQLLMPSWAGTDTSWIQTALVSIQN